MVERAITLVWKWKWSIVFILFIIASIVFNKPDPTDAGSGLFDRSGMGWYKDYGTGCEYLTSGGLFRSGNLIRRMGKDGKHICNEEY